MYQLLNYSRDWNLRHITYKYYIIIVIIVDQKFSFQSNIENFVLKLKVKLGFSFINTSCFSIQVRKYLVSATFLSLLNYDDLLNINASELCVWKLGIVYLCALCLITGCRGLVHYHTLYFCWLSYCLVFMYKSLPGLVPSYLCKYMHRNQNQ